MTEKDDTTYWPISAEDYMRGFGSAQQLVNKAQLIVMGPGRQILKNRDGDLTMGSVSDGYHTFDELYEHRAVLFIALCNMVSRWERDLYPIGSYKTVWKSRKHSDGSMFEGYFIAGIKTPEGDATYHVKNEYWDRIKWSIELVEAPEWDGHTPKDALERINKMFN
jgi:hypothetical protein